MTPTLLAVLIHQNHSSRFSFVVYFSKKFMHFKTYCLSSNLCFSVRNFIVADDAIMRLYRKIIIKNK